MVDSGLEPKSGQTKDYEIDICCFSARHTVLKSKNKDLADLKSVFCVCEMTCLSMESFQ